MSTNMTQKSGGCGCGGGGSTAIGGWTAMAPATRCGCGGAGGSGGGCSCGGAGCATCRPDGFVYPRFFAGELLTEDDLSLLVEYVVAKNRLHNRALFGDGVVCGLDVTCHPCDPGKVIVQPGYALDCCGNDILVPCPQELDINAMVRDLRRHVKGDFDCTDPCMDRASSGANSLTNRAGANASAIFVPPVRKYCLYVRFCEQLSDPVAAYATDGSCPPQPCEPTRVREGFRFELRCPAPEREDDNVVRHFLQCAQDMITAEQSLSEGVILSPQVGRLDAATRAALTEAVPTFDATQEQALVTATARLTQALDLLSKLPPVTSGGPDSSPSLLDAVDAAREVGGLLTRLTMSTQVASLQQSKALAAERSAALAQIRRADAALADQALAAIPTPLDRDFALATMAAVRAFATADAATLASGSIEPRLFAEGAVWNARYETAFAGALSRLQSTLRLQMEKAPHPTLCSLNQIVTTTTVPTPPTPTGTILLTTQYVRPAAYVSASSQLLAAASRWWLECLCLSLNPPCQPCDDPAVLIACIDVKDCSVIDICNMVRRFVLTWLDMRYWFALGNLGPLIEALCCPSSSFSTSTGPNLLSTAVPGLANFSAFSPQGLAFAAPELSAPDVVRFRHIATLAGQLAADRLGVGGDPLSALFGLTTTTTSTNTTRGSTTTKPAATIADPAAADLLPRLAQLEAENQQLAARLTKLERRR